MIKDIYEPTISRVENVVKHVHLLKVGFFC